jgi:hypothetical protein
MWSAIGDRCGRDDGNTGSSPLTSHHALVEQVYRAESRWVFATLVRLASISTEGFFPSERTPVWQKQAVSCNLR